jgi:hypothetical protein
MADSIYNGGSVWMDHSRCRYRPSAVAGWLAAGSQRSRHRLDIAAEPTRNPVNSGPENKGVIDEAGFGVIVAFTAWPWRSRIYQDDYTQRVRAPRWRRQHNQVKIVDGMFV